jgi:hypothetical protein
MNLQDIANINRLIEARRQLVIRREQVERNGVNVYAAGSSTHLHGKDSPLQHRFAGIVIDELDKRIAAIELDLARFGVTTEDDQ